MGTADRNPDAFSARPEPPEHETGSSVDDLARLSALTLEWHRAVTTMPAERFQTWGLAQLGIRLLFDSAFWACGHFDNGTPIVHNFVLVNRPPEMLADYAQISRGDPLAAKCAAAPGTAFFINDLAEHPETPPRVRAYVRKWRIHHALSLHAVDEVCGLSTGIAVWRETDKGPFTEGCRRFFELAVPHLIESSVANRLHHLASGLREGRPGLSGAVADRHGVLQLATPEFQRLLIAEWPDWRGPRLPQPLTLLLEGGVEERYTGARACFRATPSNDLVILQARARRLADALSQREREIAQLVVRGLTRKQIASRLGIAQPTVRNHMSSAFIKLKIHKQSELAGRLGADA